MARGWASQRAFLLATAVMVLSSGGNADMLDECDRKLRYGLVIDAGSSGSRIIGFRWQHGFFLASVHQLGYHKLPGGLAMLAEEEARFTFTRLVKLGRACRFARAAGPRGPHACAAAQFPSCPNASSATRRSTSAALPGSASCPSTSASCARAPAPASPRPPPLTRRRAAALCASSTKWPLTWSLCTCADPPGWPPGARRRCTTGCRAPSPPSRGWSRVRCAGATGRGGGVGQGV